MIFKEGPPKEPEFEMARFRKANHSFSLLCLDLSNIYKIAHMKDPCVVLLVPYYTIQKTSSIIS